MPRNRKKGKECNKQLKKKQNGTFSKTIIEESENKRFKPVLKIVLALALAVLIVGLSIVKYNYEPEQIVPFTKFTVKASQIVNAHIKRIHWLIQGIQRLESMHAQDPIVAIIKSRFVGIQERVTSLKAQTYQYEKMERVSGGFSNFIESTLKELEKFNSVDLVDVNNKITKIIAEVKAEGYKYFQADKLILSMFHHFPHAFGSLREEGLNLDYLPPKDLQDNIKFDENSPSPIPMLKKLQQSLSKLSILFEQREGLASQLIAMGKIEYQAEQLDASFDLPALARILAKDLPKLKEEGQDVEIYYEVIANDADIKKDIEQNSELYQIVDSLQMMGLMALGHYSKLLIDFKEQGDYGEIKKAIEQDIQALVVRVKKLQYKYGNLINIKAKEPPELVYPSVIVVDGKKVTDDNFLD